MAKVFAFHGGIHPPENKYQSAQRPIVSAPVPEILQVPLRQHIGVAAKACVSVGDKVLKGQRIADASGKLSVPVHAPSSGVVIAIADQPVPHPSGMSGLCISIETDGLEQWIEHSGLADYKALSQNQLIDYIRDRGIAGMGGAGFPTAVKLHLGDDHIINTLIINAAECEPYITADDLLMRERAEQIIAGIEILQHLIKPSHVLIGIEDNKPKAIRALEIALQDCKYNIDVVTVPTKYPSGGEKQLIQLLTNVEVPHGGIPADVGIVCQNIGTVYAIHRAVAHGESLISRIVTVTGAGVSKAQNYETLIGTPFDTLLQAAGHNPQRTTRLVLGGPMMGYSIDNSQIPVVKTSNCIIAATAGEMPEQPDAQACIRCGLCEQVCPAQLLPQQLHWFAKSQEYDKAEQHNLFDCIECGACSFVCPSNIPLVQYYRHAKSSIREQQQDKRKADLARERFEAKQHREQRAVEEKAAKRKARAEQAAKAQAEKKALAEKSLQQPQQQLDKLAAAVPAAQAKVTAAKAQLAQANSTEGNSADINSADLQFKTATANLLKAQQAVSDFTPAAKPAIDSKKLKVAAAIANTRLNKALTALKAAQEKSQPGIESLQNTIAKLQLEAASADSAYQSAAGEPAASAAKPDVETKKLKTAVAVARTKVKRAEAKLSAAQHSGADNCSELQQQLDLLKQTLNTAELAYQQSDSSTQGSAAVTAINSAPDLKVLKTAAAVARTKLKQAQAQLAKLSPLESADTEQVQQLQQQINLLSQKVTDTEASYLQAKPTESAETDLQQLQDNYEKINKMADKAGAALLKAEADQSPAVAKMRVGIDKLKLKLDAAKQALTQGNSTDPDKPAAAMIQQQPAQPGIDKKALKQKVAIARTKLGKAQQQLAASGSENNQLSATVDQLSKAHRDALAELEAVDAAAQAKAKEMGIDLKQLRSDLALAKVTLIKAQKALAESGPDDPADKELEQRRSAVSAASEQLDSLNATLASIDTIMGS
ncbi:MAG: electron transport complex subunit RsxC [Pseudomonadales bacterium]|nr:electron transport complex subunit RsxC [Pseudomonadales bacterium]NRA17202.1 electron transport complex subunit RsxC [Oceanospirillaceae bacterium]